MTRRFSGGRLVIATHNPGKVREFDALLGPCGVAAVSAGELGLPEPEETGLTFRDNALIKAHAAAGGAGLPALADDSGLACEALDGAPGIHSARWAGAEKDFAAAMARVEAGIGSGSRRAAFVCVLALAWPNGHAETFEGRVEGGLVWPPRGDRGFGYDPMFVPDGHRETFGEMDPAAKHAISHRARAVAALLAGCFGR